MIMIKDILRLMIKLGFAKGETIMYENRYGDNIVDAILRGFKCEVQYNEPYIKISYIENEKEHEYVFKIVSDREEA